MSRRRRSSLHAPEGMIDRIMGEIVPGDEPGVNVDLVRLQRTWGEIIGPAPAKVAKPVALSDGTLYLSCVDATWAHELQTLAPTIVTKVQAAGFHAVRAVRTRTGT